MIPVETMMRIVNALERMAAAAEAQSQAYVADFERTQPLLEARLRGEEIRARLEALQIEELEFRKEPISVRFPSLADLETKNES